VGPVGSLKETVVHISHAILAKPSLELAVKGGKGLNVTVPFNTLIDAFSRDDGRNRGGGRTLVAFVWVIKESIATPWRERFIVVVV
jgi:hypothetical protein